MLPFLPYCYDLRIEAYFSHSCRNYRFILKIFLRYPFLFAYVNFELILKISFALVGGIRRSRSRDFQRLIRSSLSAGPKLGIILRATLA